jgi:hypothetical protein
MVRYNVVMFKPNGDKVYLSHNNRIKWCKRTAEKHLKDVSNNKMYTEHYIRFAIELD